MAKNTLIGSWSFLIGVVIAILVGLGVANVALTPIVVSVLILLGIIVGLLSVGAKEVEPFVMTSVVVMLAAFIGKQSGVFDGVNFVNIVSVLDALTAMIVPAAVIVALKEAFSIAKR